MTVVARFGLYLFGICTAIYIVERVAKWLRRIIPLVVEFFHKH